jgi:hypothetical protein
MGAVAAIAFFWSSVPNPAIGGLVPFVINITHLRIKPLTLASGHGRYITVTSKRTLVSVEEWPLHTTAINL